MPGENLEIARRAFSTLRDGDLGDSPWDPEVVIVNARGWLIEVTYHGHAGLRRWWQDLAEAFSDLSLELDELVELDGERVLSTQRVVGRFRTTGIPVDRAWGSIMSIGDGKVVHVEGYLTPERAKRAAGLAPDPADPEGAAPPRRAG